MAKPGALTITPSTGSVMAGGLNAKVGTEIRIDTTYDDRSQYRIGLQKAFAPSKSASFVLQASLPGDEGDKARAAIGTSFSLFGQEGYVNVEDARRFRAEGCNRWVAEVATGLEFVPGWNLTLKSWTEQGDGARSTKAEAGIDDALCGIRVRVGWREEISGDFEAKDWVMSARTAF